MRKPIVCLLCLLLLFSLSACKSPAREQEPPAAEASATPEPSEPAEPAEVPEPPETPPETEASPAPAAQEPEEATRCLVALGDSIASGYALREAQTERTSALLAAMLTQSSGERWEECNYAVAGDDSGDLLALLRAGRAEKLSQADAVTVCIGANNVLGPAERFLLTYAAYVFTASSEKPAMSVADVAKAYDDFRTEAEAGVEQLRDDIESVMALIRAENAEAPVVFMTVYNPYRLTEADIDLGGLPIPLSLMSDTFVRMVNRVIEELSGSCGYLTADVYTAFEEGGEGLVNADGADTFIADPHPTAAGHRLIAEEYCKMLAG